MAHDRERPRADSTGPRKAPGRTVSPSSFAGLGLQLAVSIILFLYLGKWVDGKLGTAPVFLIIGVFLGAAAGFYSMIRALTAAQRGDGEGGGDTNR